MTVPTLPLAPAHDVPDDGLDVDPDLLADLARLPARGCDVRVAYMLHVLGRTLWVGKDHECSRRAEWSVRVHCPGCPRTVLWLACERHRQILLRGSLCAQCSRAGLKLLDWRRV